MFYVIKGTTITTPLTDHKRFSDPVAAFNAATQLESACIILSQNEEDCTLISVMVGGKCFNCLTGECT